MTTTFARRLAASAGAVVLAVAIAACGSGAATPVPSVAAPSAGPIDLEGTSWLLTDYLSPEGAVYTVPAAVTPLASFEGGTMTGNAGCNTFTTSYEIEGDTITLGEIASTMMACEEPMASVEAAYLAALAVVDKVAILDDGKLQLWDSGGKTTLAFLKGN